MVVKHRCRLRVLSMGFKDRKPHGEWYCHGCGKKTERYLAGKEIELHNDLIAGDLPKVGTTVIYVPQCTGEKPIRFFLYPEHHASLRKALDKIRTLEKKKRPNEPRHPAWLIKYAN